MKVTRWATVAVAALLACSQAVATASCGTEAHDASGGGDGAADANSALPEAGDDSTVPGRDGNGGSFGFDSAAIDSPDGCTPAVSCPAGVQCGRYVDPCTGNVFVCGTPCPSGQVCAASVTSPPTQSCQPKACAGKCGTLGVDSCGVAVNCGGCPVGEDCVGNQCVASGSASDAGSASTCSALTCAPSAQTHFCGTVHDGCGNSMQCSCPTGQACVSGVCAPPAPECDAGGVAKCGSVVNACGSGNVNCGGCAGSNKCMGGMCTPCSPPSCGRATCGTVSNGCGPSASCGTCSASEVCEDGGCCTPTTCGAALDSGVVPGCTPVDLGCGVKKSCKPCGAGEVCVNDVCQTCTPKTCADFGNTGCGHADGCGHSLDCCGTGTTCQSGICCAPGEVDYNGSCCLPGCDLDLSPGPQLSCGQVILCSGGPTGGSSGSGSGSGSGSAQ
jgi:hypothetical protein